MIDIAIRCVPPSTTAQQKGARVAMNKSGKLIPVFYQKAAMKREEVTWAALLAPHVPSAPIAGAVALDIRMVYPHKASTRNKDKALLIPKVSKPDAGNAGKHLEDVLTRMRFIEDDRQVSRLTVEKWHGPEKHVGIKITITEIGATDAEHD